MAKRFGIMRRSEFHKGIPDYQLENRVLHVQDHQKQNEQSILAESTAGVSQPDTGKLFKLDSLQQIKKRDVVQM